MNSAPLSKVRPVAGMLAISFPRRDVLTLSPQNVQPEALAAKFFEELQIASSLKSLESVAACVCAAVLSVWHEARERAHM